MARERGGGGGSGGSVGWGRGQMARERGGGGGGGGVHLVVAYYVGRGIDQATRALEAVEHLLAAGHDLHLVTAEPEFVRYAEIASSRSTPRMHVREVDQVVLECGAPNALTVDRFASLEELYHTALVPQEAIIRSEAKWLRTINADLVISDVGCAENTNASAELSPRPMADPLTPLKSLSGLVVDGLSSPESQTKENITACLTPEVLRAWEKTPSPPSKRQRGRSLPRSPDTAQLGVPAAHRRSSSSPPSPGLKRSEMNNSSPSSQSHKRNEIRSRSPTAPGYKRSEDETMAVTKSVLRPIIVFWDTENCPVPKNMQVEQVYENIREALRLRFAVDSVKVIAYGASKGTGEILQRTGVILVDIPSNKKDAADKMILADMLLSVYAKPLGSYIMLISGDGDYTRAVKGLVEYGHHVVIAIPSVDTTAASLIKAGSCILDWPSLARGRIVIPKSLPDDISVVKANMADMFQRKGGYVELHRILPEYYKAFSKRIRLADYGAPKLVDLFVMMGSPFFVMDSKMVFLTSQPALEASSLKLQFEDPASANIATEVSVDDSFVDEDACGPIEDESVKKMITGASSNHEDKLEKGFEDA